MSRSYRHSDYITNGNSDKYGKTLSHRRFRRVEKLALSETSFDDADFPESQSEVYNSCMMNTRCYFGDHPDSTFVASRRRK